MGVIPMPEQASDSSDSADEDTNPKPEGTGKKEDSNKEKLEKRKIAVIWEVNEFNKEYPTFEKLQLEVKKMHATIWERLDKVLNTLNANQWPDHPRRTASQMTLPSFKTVLHSLNAGTAPEAAREAVISLQSMALLKFAKELEKAEIGLGVVGTEMHLASINLAHRGYGENEEDIRELMGDEADRTYTSIRKDRAALETAVKDGFHRALKPLCKLFHAYHMFAADAAKNCNTEKLRADHEKSPDDQYDHIMELLDGLFVANDRSTLLEEAYHEKGKELEAAMTYVAGLEEGDWATKLYEMFNIDIRRDLRMLFPKVISENSAG